MGKVKPAPQGAEKNDSQTNPSSRRSSRGATPKEDITIAGTPAADPLPGLSNLERRRLAAALPGSNTASGIKRPPSTARKLSALSAHKRRLPTDTATPGGPTQSTSKRQISSPPQKQTSATPSQDQPMEEPKSPPNKGAPPMTVAEVFACLDLIKYPPCSIPTCLSHRNNNNCVLVGFLLNSFNRLKN
jgi:hypothetical protein